MGRRSGLQVLIIGSERIVSYKIGIEQPFRHLERAGVCHFKVLADDDADKGDLAAADVILFFRTVQPNAYKLLEIANGMGKKTVYVIDDHFMAMAPGSDMGRFYHEPARRDTYVKFLKNAGIVKVASDFFAWHLQTHFQPRSVVSFPGSVDFALLDSFDRPGKSDGRVYIGYEGGRKEAAFAPVIQALRGIARKYGDQVKIEFFGYIPEGLEGLHQVTFAHHDDNYQNFLKRLYRSNWDIGLAPLEHTLLHDCKTNNKYREYGACGIAGIYSDAPPYSGWVNHRSNGMLAGPGREAWYESLCELIEQPQLRAQIQEAAQAQARERFSIEACAESWRTQILQS
ncbi:glycosyltransferase family 1 protein [Paenibacillus sp. 1P07SE]|uniref:glycosyltransferase family 1 protein n=1 Tax=Paenibacillus sp. 1P07SE TaxID=3132209 RepID=UPI0039A45BBA